ncbi:MAG: hypothetical protein JO257_27460 [Deltaproteobacteria bacterium]|nr:hypothetical protein [Deltaproteobacteria bacterium]
METVDDRRQLIFPRIADAFVDCGAEAFDEARVSDVTAADHRVDVTAVVGAEPGKLAYDDINDAEDLDLEPLQVQSKRTPVGDVRQERNAVRDNLDVEPVLPVKVGALPGESVEALLDGVSVLRRLEDITVLCHALIARLQQESGAAEDRKSDLRRVL